MLTDHNYLIFDVYGTLVDWETGLYTTLQPLLARYPESTKNWTRKDVLTAFGSIELDLQTRFPDMLYSDILSKVYQVLEGTLSADEPLAKTSTSNEHITFGNSIKHWPLFPDTSEALVRLSAHFKLIVLSNVDRTSFRHTHALLSGEPYPTPESQLELYTYPDINNNNNNSPYKYWHPKLQAGPNSKSPFTLILTAQDTRCYKPALGGFLTTLQYINDHPDLFGKVPSKEQALDSIKDKVLSVAQSLTHDHEPASELGLKSVWIDRQTAVTCNVTPGGPDAKDKWTWRFETLGEMADAVEKELAAK